MPAIVGLANREETPVRRQIDQKPSPDRRLMTRRRRRDNRRLLFRPPPGDDRFFHRRGPRWKARVPGFSRSMNLPSKNAARKSKLTSDRVQ
jgi:hypothetical protein